MKKNIHFISSCSKKLKRKVFPVVLILFLVTNVFSQTICKNETGTHDGFTYAYWKSSGDGCMILKPGGGFSIEWKNVGNLLARKSTRPGSKNQVINYDVDFKPTPNTGKSFVSLYGWTQKPLVEYYVVEAWSDSRPTKGTLLGTHTSDGAEYELYRTERVNKPSIEGTKTFYQYWSIRKTERTSGTITAANHFKAWEKAGLSLGTLWEVSLLIETLKDSAGFAEVKSMTMTNGTNLSSGNDLEYANSKLIVFPNPSTDGKFNFNNEISYKVYDLFGNLIQNDKGDKSDLSSYSSGIYILNVGSKNIKLVRQ